MQLVLFQEEVISALVLVSGLERWLSPLTLLFRRPQREQRISLVVVSISRSDVRI